MKQAFRVILCLIVFSGLFSFVGAVAADNLELCVETSIRIENESPTGTLSATFQLLDLSANILAQHTYLVQPGQQINTVLHDKINVASRTAWTVSLNATFIPSDTPVQSFSIEAGSGAVGLPNCTGIFFGQIGDGRINDGPDQEGAPLAAYCASGGITIYDIDDSGQGTFAFTASLGQIHTALSKAISSGQNVLIGQGLGDSLYALSSNQLTLTGPDVKEPSKTYDFITTPDVCG